MTTEKVDEEKTNDEEFYEFMASWSERKIYWTLIHLWFWRNRFNLVQISWEMEWFCDIIADIQ